MREGSGVFAKGANVDKGGNADIGKSLTISGSLDDKAE